MKNGKYCILIADDEKEIRDILRLLLEGEGYAVLTAEDGREAIASPTAAGQITRKSETSIFSTFYRVPK